MASVREEVLLAFRHSQLCHRRKLGSAKLLEVRRMVSRVSMAAIPPSAEAMTRLPADTPTPASDRARPKSVV